jgi:hypothetical protein
MFPKPLPNGHNICWINSALQMLLNWPEFMSCFLSNPSNRTFDELLREASREHAVSVRDALVTVCELYSNPQYQNNVSILLLQLPWSIAHRIKLTPGQYHAAATVSEDLIKRTVKKWGPATMLNCLRWSECHALDVWHQPLSQKPP